MGGPRQRNEGHEPYRGRGKWRDHACCNRGRRARSERPQRPQRTKSERGDRGAGERIMQGRSSIHLAAHPFQPLPGRQNATLSMREQFDTLVGI